MHTYGYLKTFVTLAVLRIFGPAAFLEESSVIAHRLQSIPRTGRSPSSDPVSKRSLILGLKDSGNFVGPLTAEFGPMGSASQDLTRNFAIL